MEYSTQEYIGEMIVKEIAIGVLFSILAFVFWCCSPTFNERKMENFLKHLFLTLVVVISTMMIQHFVLYNVYQYDHQLRFLHSAFVATTFVQCFSFRQNDCEYIMSAVFSQIVTSFILFILSYLLKSLFFNDSKDSIVVIDMILTIVAFIVCFTMLADYLKEQRQVF